MNLSGIRNETNTVRHIQQHLVSSRIRVYDTWIKNDTCGISVTEVPEIGVPLGRGILKIDAEVFTTLNIRAGEFCRRNKLKIELKDQIIAIGTVICA